MQNLCLQILPQHKQEKLCAGQDGNGVGVAKGAYLKDLRIFEKFVKDFIFS